MTAPALSRAKRGGGRVYLWDGVEYPSVTTILGATMPKPALVGWAARTVAEYAVANQGAVSALLASGDERAAIDLLKGSPFRDRDRAADVGTRVHAVAEALANGVSVPVVGTDVEPFLPHFLRFMEDWRPEYVETEATVFNTKAGYAGTLDAIAVVGGHLTLLDTKTGKDVYPEVALQLAAYSDADCFIGRDDGETVDALPRVTRYAVLHLRPDGYRLVPIMVDYEQRRMWRRLVENFRYLDGPAERVIGAEMRPEVAA